MHYDDITEISCRTCGEAFEAGEKVRAVWGGPVDADGAFDGQNLEFHHGSCAKVADRRPDPVRLLERENANGEKVTHVMRPESLVSLESPLRSYCGSISGVERDAAEKERVGRRSLRSREDVCPNCVRSLSRERR